MAEPGNVRAELRPIGAAEPVTEATATLVRHSLAARLGWAALFGLGGLIGGLFFLPIPILHLCLTWVLPLAGAFAAFRAFSTEVTLREIAGPCPCCQAPVQLEGGGGAGPHFGNCAGCRQALEAKLAG